MNNNGLKDRKVLEEWDKTRIEIKKLAFQTGKDLSKIPITKSMRMENSKICVDFRGERKTLKEISEMTGISQSALYQRYRMGDEGDRLVRPLRNNGRGRHSGS